MSKNDEQKSFTSSPINWYPGHMAKTKKQIIDDLKLIDVIIELLDARIPISSSNPDIDSIAKNKKRIVVLNKKDLADDIETKRWIEYYKKKEIVAVATNVNHEQDIEKVIKEIEKIMDEEVKNMENKGRIGRTIRVAILGIPNVGKSSFINKVTKKNRLIVGNKPGVTKAKQWIRINEKIDLLDTPGILWPKLEENVGLNLAYIGSIKDDILEKIEVSYCLFKFLLENYIEKVIERYKIDKNTIDEILNRYEPENENIYEIMKMIGRKRGAIVSGGKVDDEKLANIILDDFRSGKLGKITLEKI